MALFHQSADRKVSIVDSHLKDAGQLAQEARECLFGNVACADWIEFCPSLLETADLLSANDGESAAPLVHIREVLVDERDEQIDEDVHAQNVPGDKQRTCPLLAAAVAIEVALADSAEWSVNLGKVFHKSVPAFSYTCPKKQDEGLWHRAEVCVIACLLTEPGEAEHLCERNCKHQEKDKPGCQQINN